MAYGFNDNKSKAPLFNDVFKIQDVTITTNPIPPYAGAEMGGAVNVSNSLPGYRPIGIIGWRMMQKVSPRVIYINNVGLDSETVVYTLTNLTSSSVDNVFYVTILYMKK